MGLLQATGRLSLVRSGYPQQIIEVGRQGQNPVTRNGSIEVYPSRTDRDAWLERVASETSCLHPSLPFYAASAVPVRFLVHP